MPAALLVWRRPRWWPLLFLLAGVLWTTFRAGLILADRLPAALEGRDLEVEGRIADIPQRSERVVRFPFRVDRARLPDGEAVVVPRRILLSHYDSDWDPQVGQRYRLRVRLKRPYGFQNPGGFDYEGDLFRKRIRATGYVRPEGAPVLLAAPGLAAGVGRWRQEIGRHISALLPSVDSTGILVALANGDTQGIRDDQWQVLQRTGTLHLVAISGSHIGLVAGWVFFLVRWLWARFGAAVLWLPAPRAAAAAALLAAAGYSALAGFAVPTQRALIMLAVTLGAVTGRWRPGAYTVLALALLAVLVYDPLSVMAPGFWLSFTAVAVILYALHARRTGQGAFLRLLLLQGVLTLALAPLSLAFFQQAPVVGSLANLLAIPVFELAVVPLVLTGLLALASPAVAAGLFQAAAWLVDRLWAVLTTLAQAEQALRPAWAPAGWALVCAGVGVLLLAAPRGWPARWLGLIWLLPLALVRPPAPEAGEVWFTLLDVGQGLAAVVRTQTHTLVYDTGPRFSERFDTGRAVVVPYLRGAGVGRIDRLVLSHPDNDHIGGSASVHAALPVADVLSSTPVPALASQPCRAGQRWRWDGVEFTVLGPSAGVAGPRNDASCVLRVVGPYGRLLLPGDIEAGAEHRLVETYGSALAADVLVAPHHGSKTSSTEAFLAAVGPRVALFPVGYRNRYHHPHARVLARYRGRTAAILSSPAHGAIEIRLAPSGLALASYRQAHRRYWFSD